MAAGVTFYDQIDTKHKDNWDVLVMHIARMLAGSEAEVILAGGDESVRSTGRSSDVDRAGRIARRFIVDGHLVTELDGISAYMDQNGNLLPTMPAKMREVLNAKVHEAIEAGRELAQKHLKENWHIVHAGAELLIQNHTISGEDFVRLVERANEAKEKATAEQRVAVAEGAVKADEVYKFSLEGIVVKKNNNKGQAASQPQETGNACHDLLSSKAG
jgi:ATP-dependent Zn protease